MPRNEPQVIHKLLKVLQIGYVVGVPTSKSIDLGLLLTIHFRKRYCMKLSPKEPMYATNMEANLY